MTKLKSREIRGTLTLAGHTHIIINDELLCPSCQVWSNGIEWFIHIKPDFKQCPNCKEKHID